jgi:hypothetical protein
MTDAATPPEPSRLAAVVDGAPLDPEAARALWTEFSAHMDEHRGDMSGFATKKGWKSVAPEYQRGKAVLLVRTGGPMKAAPPPKPAANPPPARAPNKQAGPSRARKQAEPRASKPSSPQKKGPPPHTKKGPPKTQPKKGSPPKQRP